MGNKQLISLFLAIFVLCIFFSLLALFMNRVVNAPKAPYVIAPYVREDINRPYIAPPQDDRALRATSTKRGSIPYEVIGHSVEGRDIRAYRYGTGPNLIVFVGAIHGGYTWNTAILAYDAIDEFIANPALVPSDISVVFIPVANPDGLFKIVGSSDRFGELEAPKFKLANEVAPTDVVVSGRFNKHTVDLNRNFACTWQPHAKWRTYAVSAGTEAFSEPETMALRDFFLKKKPVAVVFWSSASNGVYGSSCDGVTAPGMAELLHTYAEASGYPEYKEYQHYEITGAGTNWLATQGVPAITAELSEHDVTDWEKNWPAIHALMKAYSKTE